MFPLKLRRNICSIVSYEIDPQFLFVRFPESRKHIFSNLALARDLKPGAEPMKKFLCRSLFGAGIHQSKESHNNFCHFDWLILA